MARILVVDDDEQVARLLVRVLSGDHSCTVAHDSKSALGVLDVEDIAVVLIDIGLADESGLDLAKHILATFTRAAVVMVTGNDDPDVARVALDLGAYGYVIKPFGASEMRIAVDNAVRRRRLELENQVMVVELCELNDSKDALIAAVSHDLANPITAIGGFASVIDRALDRLTPEQIRSHLANIVQSADRMTAILQGVLDRDRVARGVLVSKDTDVGELAERTARGVDIGDRVITIDCPPVAAAVDPVMVERIVENLVANAAKHTPAGTRISVHVAARDEGVEVRVEDEGPGVSDDLKPTIFERYRRGETVAPGSGVGLSLVDWFAHLHGGTAWVADRPGGGCVFGVWLPAEPVTPAP
jgi:signal transduction histidine kinase